MVDSLWDEYTRGWVDHFTEAFDAFRAHVAVAKQTRYDDTPSDYWTKYTQLTRVNSDRADTIERRHRFFVEKMYQMLKPRLKDRDRNYGLLERELIYYRDQKKCQECDGDVPWVDVDIHHVEEHSKNGPTTLENGALVHRHCHPKGERAVAEFAKRWKLKRAAAA